MELKPVRFRQTRQGVRDLDQWNEPIVPISGGPLPPSVRLPNLGQMESSVSLLAGAGLIGFGLAQKTASGLLLGLAGSALLYRGWTRHCSLYSLFGLSSASPTEAPQEMAYVSS
jgi:hypothetical protein